MRISRLRRSFAYWTGLLLAAALLWPWAGTVLAQQPDRSLAMPPAGGATAKAIAALQKVPFKGKFTFLFMGDNRNGTPTSREGDETFARLVTKANREQALFAFNDGDLTYQGTAEEWERFAQISGKLKFPMITAIGNHELPGRAYYEQAYTPPNPHTGLADYSFDYGDSRFVILDNANGNLTDRQLDWLSAQLHVKRRHKFVGMHIPPFFNVWGNQSMQIGLASLQFFATVQSERVDYVLLSHIHVYDDSMKIQGVKYLVSGGAGAPLTQVGFGRPIHHYVRLTVDKDRVWHSMVPV